MPPLLILGSASPRRRALLQALGVPFQVRVVDVDEDQVTLDDPVGNVLARARLKGGALAEMLPEGEPAVVITADTVVADGRQLLNKPADPAEAWVMLARLRGRPHEVHTAVVVQKTTASETQAGTVFENVATSEVWMRPYTDEEIAAYIATGDPLDKAGAYAIQHPVFRPAARLRGCYTSVIGFPVCRVAQLLRQAGVDLPAGAPAAVADDWRECDFCTSLAGVDRG